MWVGKFGGGAREESACVFIIISPPSPPIPLHYYYSTVFILFLLFCWHTLTTISLLQAPQTLLVRERAETARRTSHIAAHHPPPTGPHQHRKQPLRYTPERRFSIINRKEFLIDLWMRACFKRDARVVFLIIIIPRASFYLCMYIASAFLCIIM